MCNKLHYTKAELESLRAKKVKGQLVRSRLQWLQDGGGPSKFLFSLENKNYRTSSRKSNNQELILEEIDKYHSNLFENKDKTLQNINLDELEITKNMKTIEDVCTPLEVEEFGLILKRIKALNLHLLTVSKVLDPCHIQSHSP